MYDLSFLALNLVNNFFSYLYLLRIWDHQFFCKVPSPDFCVCVVHEVTSHSDSRRNGCTTGRIWLFPTCPLGNRSTLLVPLIDWGPAMCTRVWYNVVLHIDIHKLQLNYNYIFKYIFVNTKKITKNMFMQIRGFSRGVYLHCQTHTHSRRWRQMYVVKSQLGSV